MAKKLDFKQFKKPEQSILVQMESEKKEAQKQKTKTTSSSNKSPSTLGRPKIGDDIITKRFSIGFVEKEYQTLQEKAGRVPISVFIKDILRDAKVL